MRLLGRCSVGSCGRNMNAKRHRTGDSGVGDSGNGGGDNDNCDTRNGAGMRE